MATKASRTTPNIGLSQWEATDFVCREDFNADNMLIDTAIGEGCKIAYGSYIGTGTYGANNKSSLTFDFEPKLVMIFNSNGATNTGNVHTRGMICIRGAAVGGKFLTFVTNLIWEENTLYWYHTPTSSNSYAASEQLNATGETYYYVALG